MPNNRFSLKVPKIEELEYRRKLLSDSDTMSYNKGYGVNGTGCYFITKEDSEAWYQNWFSVPDRYYAYVMKIDDNTPIGDVNIHYDKNYNTNMIGIVIEAKHRGKGYSEEILRLLADKAFYDLKLNEIADDFPADRVVAEKAFKKIGFVRKDERLVVLTRRDYEANY